MKTSLPAAIGTTLHQKPLQVPLANRATIYGINPDLNLAFQFIEGHAESRCELRVRFVLRFIVMSEKGQCGFYRFSRILKPAGLDERLNVRINLAGKIDALRRTSRRALTLPT